MEYRKFGSVYVVRLDRGDEVVASITELCRKEFIRLASIEGLGAADHAVVGLYDVEEKKFHGTELNGPMEITSLIGNVTTKDGKVYLHIHINLCDETAAAKGGHLVECRISATSEIFVRTVAGTVERRLDEEVTGLNLFAFL